MSKISDLNLALQEQAEELGFETTQEALDAGYEVDYEARELVNPYVLGSDPQTEAHEAWLKERDEVLKGLCWAIDYIAEDDDDTTPHIIAELKHAIEFVKKGEC